MVDRNTLIRLVALCNLLVSTLEEAGSEALAGNVALVELRDVVIRAVEELDQLVRSASG